MVRLCLRGHSAHQPAVSGSGCISPLIAWLAQTFLQLVLLSVIMVGQKVAAAASDKQALQTFRDAEALLKLQDEMRRLIEVNNDLT